MSKNDIFERVVQVIRNVLPDLDNHTFEFDDRLVDLGADSVDRAEIVNMLLEDLSLDIPRVELSRVKNIGELTETLYGKLQSV